MGDAIGSGVSSKKFILSDTILTFVKVSNAHVIPRAHHHCYTALKLKKECPSDHGEQHDPPTRHPSLAV